MNKSTKNPYTKFLEEELILRDHLAIDRTILSNESTMLAYIRTSLTIIVVGATIIHFLSNYYIEGGLFILCGIVVLIFGYLRYRKMDKLIKEIKRI